MMMKFWVVLAAMVNSAQMKASEQSESFADEVFGDVESLPEKMEMGWKDMIMVHWSTMSSVHKFILVAVVVLLVVWIVCKFMKSGKDCCKGE